MARHCQIIGSHITSRSELIIINKCVEQASIEKYFRKTFLIRKSCLTYVTSKSSIRIESWFDRERWICNGIADNWFSHCQSWCELIIYEFVYRTSIEKLFQKIFPLFTGQFVWKKSSRGRKTIPLSTFRRF